MAKWDVWSRDARSGQWMVIEESGVDEATAEQAARRRNTAAAMHGMTDALYQAVERGQQPVNEPVPNGPVLQLVPLPVGSVVAGRDVVYLRNHPTVTSQWRGTNGSYVSDEFIQHEIDDNGAVILRRGRF